MTLPMFPAGPLPVQIPTKKLRPYQERAIRILRMHFELGKRRVLAVGPTGLGKMVLIANITRSSNLPTLFVAHRRELINQCVDQLAACGITQVGVMRGDDDRVDPSASTQVCSIQTLMRRDKPFQGQRVLIHIDEAHRSGSDSYIDHVFRAYPDAYILGWTATPVRLDLRPLGGELFEVLEVVATYEELFKKPDWLVRPIAFSTDFKPDLSRVRISGTDYDEEQLGELMHSDRLEGNIIAHWKKWANKYPQEGVAKWTEGDYRRTLVFAVNIAHSESLAARFEKEGARTAHLDGTTRGEVRAAILSDLAAGKLDVVCNCNVLLEGVDIPEIKCVAHARPTRSITLWRQSCGRPMRPWKGVIPLILDHADNWDRLGCPFEDLQWSLTDKPHRRSGRLPMKLCKGCFAYCEPGRALCPYCGREFRREDNPTIPRETSGDLVERMAESDDLKRAFFARQVDTARARGFRPGYASALYRERYGAWPPDEWSEKVKNEYAQDKAWQERMARRLKKKEEREAREKREEEALSAPLDPNPLEPSELEDQLAGTREAIDGDETFADWWEKQ